MPNGTSSSSSAVPSPPWNQLKLLKGALYSINTKTNRKIKIPFQYNPATIVRTINPAGMASKKGKKEAVQPSRSRGQDAQRKVAIPDQTITLTAQFEAFSASYSGAKAGIEGYLAALELLLYPSSVDITKRKLEASQGVLQITPPIMNRILFEWGPRRLLPIDLSSVQVTEKDYTNELSPVRAEVALTMRVLPLDENQEDDYELLLFYVKQLESLRNEALAAGTFDKGAST